MSSLKTGQIVEYPVQVFHESNDRLVTHAEVVASGTVTCKVGNLVVIKSEGDNIPHVRQISAGQLVLPPNARHA